MPKFTVKSTELVGTDVDIVSLVHKGASRIPFRIMKEDNEPMLDLHSIARKAISKAAGSVGPSVLAVVLRKGADLGVYTQVIEKAGLSVAKMEEKDGLIIYKQDGASEVNPQTMKINDDLGLIIGGMQKGFESWDWQSTSLKDMFSTEGFYPSMWLGLDLLGATFGNIMQKAETPAEAKEQLSKAVDEFKSWMEGIAGAIPDHAFKMDHILRSNDWKPVEKDGKTTIEPTAKAAAKKEDISTSPTFGNATSTAQVAASGDQNIDANPVHGNETPAAGGGKEKLPGPVDNNIEGNPVEKTAEQKAAEAAEAKKAETDPVLLALAGLTTKITENATKHEVALKGVNDKMTALDSRVEAVATQAKKTEAAVLGTVVTEAAGDRTQKTERAVKSIPLLDTGLRPNVQ